MAACADKAVLVGSKQCFEADEERMSITQWVNVSFAKLLGEFETLGNTYLCSILMFSGDRAACLGCDRQTYR